MRCVHGGDFDAARGAGRLDDLGTAELDRSKARRLLVAAMLPPDSAQLPVGLPRMFWIFLPRKDAILRIMISEEFFAAAISAVVEFGSAETVSGVAQEPALSAAILRSPM